MHRCVGLAPAVLPTVCSAGVARTSLADRAGAAPHRALSSSRQKSRDPWKVLGVARGASMNDVRKAYLEQSKKWHPDMHAASPPHCANRRSSHAEFRIIKHAYDTLRYKRGIAYKEAVADGARQEPRAHEQGWTNRQFAVYLAGMATLSGAFVTSWSTMMSDKERRLEQMRLRATEEKMRMQGMHHRLSDQTAAERQARQLQEWEALFDPAEVKHLRQNRKEKVLQFALGQAFRGFFVWGGATAATILVVAAAHKTGAWNVKRLPIYLRHPPSLAFYITGMGTGGFFYRGYHAASPLGKLYKGTGVQSDATADPVQVGDATPVLQMADGDAEETR